MYYRIINSKDETFKKYQDDIYKLRHKVFKETLNWNVNSIDGKEIDYFDSLDNLYYILVFQDDNLIGCMRLPPTTNDYMLEKVFPQLLENQEIPKNENFWELSRFAINPTLQKNNDMLSFNEATLLLIKGICEFAKLKNITSYLAVTTDRMDRLVKKLKMDAKTIGQRIRIEKTNVIALHVFMNEQSFKAIDDALAD